MKTESSVGDSKSRLYAKPSPDTEGSALSVTFRHPTMQAEAQRSLISPLDKSLQPGDDLSEFIVITE